MPPEGGSPRPNNPVSRFRVTCGDVLLDESRLVELEAGRIMVEVQHADIRKITLAVGLVSHHPFLQAFLGLGMASTAILPGMMILRWANHVDVLFKPALFILPFSVIGVVTFFGSFRDGHFLEIETARGLKRLAFRRKTDPALIEAFVQQIEQHLGVSIEREPGAVAKTKTK